MINIKNICSLMLGCLFILASCTDDDLVNHKTYNIKEGVPVTMSLNYGVKQSAISTRSAQDATTELTVNRLFVIAFNQRGEVSGKVYSEDIVTEGYGSVQLEMKSGEGQQIFAVANPNSGVGTLNYETLNAVTSLEEFKTLTSSLRSGEKYTVERMAFLMSGQLKNTDGGTDIAVDTEGNIVNCDGNPTIELERVDARITFNIAVEAPQGYTNMTFTPSYYRVENIPQGTYLIPQINEDGTPKDYVDAGYASMSESNRTYYFDDASREGDDRPYFEFYILENRLTPKQRITQEIKNSQYNEAEILYALREKRDKDESQQPDGSKPGQEYVLGDLTFANDNSTYVQIRGTLSYESTSGDEFISADVTYTVHLGSTGSEPDSEDLVNDYNTYRNTHYTYNVTITGVNSMRVEVLDDRVEERPGMEGDVIVGGGKVLDIDSHYGRQKFTLQRGAVKSGLSWAVSTPFQRGLKVFDKSNYTEDGTESGTVVTDENQLTEEQIQKLQTDLTLNDYRWVQFAINQECIRDGQPVSPDYFAKYPGYMAYSKTNMTQPANAFHGDGYHVTGVYDSDVILYDVNQLLNHLYIEANDPSSTIFLKDGQPSQDDDAEVTITAYIDEYIYIYDPTKEYYRVPDAVEAGDPNLQLWKQTVNGDSRMLHICEEGASYSPDGNTSWAESVITFSQKPIYTFYDPNSDVNTAWGTESDMETPELPVTGSNARTQSGNTADNGRKNTVDVIMNSTRGLKWTDVLNLEEDGYGKLKTDYNSIWYACLGRNRDLDGDNIVDRNEIRWYLASIDQLTDLWIGDAAVPNARLYQETATRAEVPLAHIASSTYFNTTNGVNQPWIIWAEEGASRGGYNVSGDDSYGKSERYYRCVRNLGLSLAQIEAEVDDYVIESDETSYTRQEGSRYDLETVTYTERVIDVSRLEANTLRSPLFDAILPNNSIVERDDNNRPYRKFAVLVKAQGEDRRSDYTNESGLYPKNSTSIWRTLYSSERNGNPCPDGYRIPNQREFMLIYTTYPELTPSQDESWVYMTKTGFSYNGWGGYVDDYGNANRPGFAYDRGNMYLLDNANQAVRVRCVRDIE